MIEQGTKELHLRQFAVEYLGLKLGNKYMELLNETVKKSSNGRETIDEFFRHFSNQEIADSLKYDLKKYVSVVKDTRLARKMYPDYHIRPDGKLVIEINPPMKG